MMIGKQGEGTQKRTEMCERGVVSSTVAMLEDGIKANVVAAA